MQDLMFGLEIAVAGMFIVVATLVILSLCIELAEYLINKIMKRDDSSSGKAGGSKTGAMGKKMEDKIEATGEQVDAEKDNQVIAAVCAAALAAYRGERELLPSSSISIKSIRPMHDNAWRLEGRRQLCHRQVSLKN